jgi:septal ring factor EnvC (AmiA/AmiB activator)
MPPAERRRARSVRPAPGRRILLAALVALLTALPVAPLAAQPDDPETMRARLTELRQRIGEISESLVQRREQRDREQAELAAAEKAMGRIERAMRQTREQLDATRAGLAALDRRAEQLQSEIGERRDTLAEQLRLAYRTGLRSRLKALLNQEDPARISRVLALHGYLGRARARTIEALSLTLERLDAVRAEQQRLALELDRLAGRQADERAELDRAVARRAEAVATLEARIRDESARLAELRSAAERLEQLLARLSSALADIPPDAEIRPFVELRGSLPMPVEAPVRAAFADARSGNVDWEGWLIGSEIGSEVRAVAYGRVAYADWLRGYGMLLIVDHGDGYMTLYGQNRSLLAEVGDWVEPGQVVALAGDSGGFGRPGLYFQIRHEGRPVDPAGWVDR